jgi:xanthine/uracil/vitamin C permease (AzgA family)
LFLQVPDFVNEKGAWPRQMWTMVVDGLAIVIGSTLGTSPLTAFAESAVPIRLGGHTGITALIMSCGFGISMVREYPPNLRIVSPCFEIALPFLAGLHAAVIVVKGHCLCAPFNAVFVANICQYSAVCDWSSYYPCRRPDDGGVAIHPVSVTTCQGFV